MKLIKQLLERKGTDILSVSPSTSVLEAITLMAQKHIGALVVLQQGVVVGIVSERDYAHKVILQGRSSKDTAVSEIMTSKVIYTHPKSTTDECMALMTRKNIRHLPVMENDKLVGIISIRDLVKDLIEEQQILIDQLVNYINT